MATACPLCRDTAKMKRPRSLYGHEVCRRCWGRFITRRQLAWIIDVFSLQFVVGFLIGFLAAVSGRDKDVPGLVLLLAIYAVMFFKDGFQGHSLGKAICGVQVVNQDSGKPTGFGASFLRNWILA